MGGDSSEGGVASGSILRDDREGREFVFGGDASTGEVAPGSGTRDITNEDDLAATVTVLDTDGVAASMILTNEKDLAITATVKALPKLFVPVSIVTA